MLNGFDELKTIMPAAADEESHWARSMANRVCLHFMNP